jgi:hypothetical protein
LGLPRAADAMPDGARALSCPLDATAGSTPASGTEGDTMNKGQVTEDEFDALPENERMARLVNGLYGSAPWEELDDQMREALILYVSDEKFRAVTNAVAFGGAPPDVIVEFPDGSEWSTKDARRRASK